jgi:glycosyltransferase involved in cell wall biosynthesis
MRVAVISKASRYCGGASKVAEDLAMWLNDVGHPTDHFIAFSERESLPFQKSLYGHGLNLKLCKFIHSTTRRVGFSEFLPVEYWFNLSRIIDEYDVIHFHDLYTAIAPLTLALTCQRKPTFFTVHDCSVFTGGCLYPVECDKFISHCHQCPQLPQRTWKDQLRDHTREIQTIKRYISQQFNINYIFPSHWIARQANLALKFKVSPTVIPNGIDLHYFIYENKLGAKECLKISKGRQVIVISANYLAASHKGVKYAIAALQSVREYFPLVITVGHCNEELRQALQGLEIREMGFISDPMLLAQVFSASDIMLFCSLADNLPLTVLEAMAASTVVVGFSTGGVPEMIQTGRNGILVEPMNQDALNHALRQALLSGHLELMGQQARQDVETNFSKMNFLERHLQLYQEAQPLSSESSQLPVLANSDI